MRAFSRSAIKGPCVFACVRKNATPGHAGVSGVNLVVKKTPKRPKGASVSPSSRAVFVVLRKISFSEMKKPGLGDSGSFPGFGGAAPRSRRPGPAVPGTGSSYDAPEQFNKWKVQMILSPSAFFLVLSSFHRNNACAAAGWSCIYTQYSKPDTASV